MMGSLTFIMVAFMCRLSSTPLWRASAISASRKASSARRDRKVLSMISPAWRGSFFSTVTVPSAATCSMRASVAWAMVTDCSLWKKSPAPMVATWVRESDDQAPMRCGFWRAYSLTATGARRSELPSRRTGLTALPLTLS